MDLARTGACGNRVGHSDEAVCRLDVAAAFSLQLATLFEQTGSIPKRAADIMDKMVRLALEDGDERQPITREFAAYLNERPAPFAVATALSSYPEMWLAQLLLTNYTLDRLSAGSLRSFLARLLQERVVLPPSIALGLTGLALACYADLTDEYTTQFLTQSAVRASLPLVLGYFTAQREPEGYILRRKRESELSVQPEPPKQLWISHAKLPLLEEWELLRIRDLST